MTYREKIQELIETINKIDDEAEALRDYANEIEKWHWNHLRGGCAALRQDLQTLDNNLPKARAAMKID